MEMDNHMSDKDDSCYDNAEAAFSDDEEDLNSKGEGCSQPGTVAPSTSVSGQWQPALCHRSPSCWEVPQLQAQSLKAPLHEQQGSLHSRQTQFSTRRLPSAGDAQPDALLLPGSLRLLQLRAQRERPWGLVALCGDSLELHTSQRSPFLALSPLWMSE